MENIGQIAHKISYDHRKVTKVTSHKNHMIHKKSVTEVDNIVLDLVEQFNAPAFIPLFRKAGWYLPEHIVRDKAARASEQKEANPLAYFIVCIKRELRLANGRA